MELVNAKSPSAVVAGNVETSNRIADAVLAALSGFAPEDLPAQGQGTMNNASSILLITKLLTSYAE